MAPDSNTEQAAILQPGSRTTTRMGINEGLVWPHVDMFYLTCMHACIRHLSGYDILHSPGTSLEAPQSSLHIFYDLLCVSSGVEPIPDSYNQDVNSQVSGTTSNGRWECLSISVYKCFPNNSHQLVGHNVLEEFHICFKYDPTSSSAVDDFKIKSW